MVHVTGFHKDVRIEITRTCKVKLVSGRFDTKSFRYKSKSFRYKSKVVSIQIKSRFDTNQKSKI